MQVTTTKTVIHVSKSNLQTVEVFKGKDTEQEQGKIWCRLDYGKFHPQSGEKTTTLIGPFESIEKANEVAENLTF